MWKIPCLPCVLMLIVGCCGNECSAESVVVAATFRNDRGTITESTGTAFVVHSNERGSILLTCKHVIEDAGESVWIAHNGKWVKCGHVMLHPTEDVAAFECSVQLKSVPLIEEIPAGSQVIVMVLDRLFIRLTKNGSFVVRLFRTTRLKAMVAWQLSRVIPAGQCLRKLQTESMRRVESFMPNLGRHQRG